MKLIEERLSLPEVIFMFMYFRKILILEDREVSLFLSCHLVNAELFLPKF